LEQLQPFYGLQDQSSLVNTGYALQVDVTGDLQFRNRRYRLRQMHFHWGTTDEHGAEHTREGVSFPLEMHLVHWDEAFPGFEEAETADNASLLVIGVHFELTKSDNKELSPILDHVNEVRLPATRSTPLTTFNLDALLPSNFKTHFQTYHGSLTTPPCFESVQWVFLASPLNISSAQLQLLRVLQRGPEALLTNNHRKPQPLNGRTVVDNSTGDDETDHDYWIYIGIGAGALLAACLFFYFIVSRRRPRMSWERDGSDRLLSTHSALRVN
jgi:carbonic anhydrase